MYLKESLLSVDIRLMFSLFCCIGSKTLGWCDSKCSLCLCHFNRWTIWPIFTKLDMNIIWLEVIPPPSSYACTVANNKMVCLPSWWGQVDVSGAMYLREICFFCVIRQRRLLIHYRRFGAKGLEFQEEFLIGLPEPLRYTDMLSRNVGAKLTGYAA